jgi:hypothetical protein
MKEPTTNTQARSCSGTSLRLLMGAVLLLALSMPPTASAQGFIVVPYNQSWKFEQSNTDLGTAWRNPGYDDSGWSNGIGPLGFPITESLTSGLAAGSSLSIQTLLNRTVAGGIQPRTYYFRTTFVISNDPRDVTLIGSNLIDDAAVFWINGVEVGRGGFNPTTVVTYSSPGDRAAGEVGDYGYDRWTNTLNLVQGTNTYAVEVHQTGNNSSDLVFAARLMAILATPIVITQHPAGGTIDQGLGVNLAVTVTGSNPRYQWYKDTNSPVAITGGTNRMLVFTNAQIADTGDYFAIVTNMISAATSQVAHIEVVPDTNGPVLLKISSDDTFRRIVLTWNEPVAEGPAIEGSSYVIFDSMASQVFVDSVVWNGSNVVLNVPMLAVDADYSIEIDYQTDLVGNYTLPVGTPDFDLNGVETNLHTWVYTPGLTLFQAYLGLPAGQNIGQFTAMPIYPNSPTFAFFTNVVNWPQTANPNVEQYAMRFSGLFLAAEDGIHKFNPAHDDDVRLRFYPGADATGVPQEMSGACCSGLLDGGTLDVQMVAGQRYYYELIVREFGGGDYAGISVITPANLTISPITPQYLAIAYDPALAVNVGIAQQPQSQTVEENHAATFTVVATNTGNSVTYQWQRNSGGGFVNILNANNISYTTPLQTLGNSGDQYRVIVIVPGKNLASAAATLTVINDTNAPQVSGVHGTRSLASIVVSFSEGVDSGAATEISNYQLVDAGSNVITLGTATLSPDNRSVMITTETQTVGMTYTLLIENVTDLSGNTMVPTNITFQAWIYSRGFVLKELYMGLSTTTVALSDLTNSPKYPNLPDLVRHGDLLELNTADEFEGYGARLSGWIVPPASGNYTFYMASDDNGIFSLNTNAPANTDLNLIAREPVWSNRRVWTGESGGGSRLTTASPSGGPAANISGAINLTAGQLYYFEALVKEGGGGDNLGVAWRPPGGVEPAIGALPISGSYLVSLADPVGASITITQQPSSISATQGQTGNFSVGAVGTNVNGSAPVAYQWQKRISGVFTDIAGANSSTYSAGALSALDDGAQFRALVFIPGASATSAVATVTITGLAPTLRFSRNGNVTTLSWDPGSHLQCATTLTPPNWKDVDTGGATTYIVDPANQFDVILDAAQSGGPPRTGSGSGTLTLSGSTLSIDVTFSGMSGTRIADHIHAPAARGFDAGIAYDLGGITTGTTSGAISGNVTLVNSAYGGKNIAAQIQDMRSQLWYINIHTTTFGGGEIRGQIEPAKARYYRLVSP